MITPAFAQTAAAGAAPDMLVQIVPFVLIFVIMYFLIIRPQQKRAKDHQALISNVRRGDVVVTTGGLIGKVSKATDAAELELEIAEGVRVRLVRGMIAEVRSKSEPVKADTPVAKTGKTKPAVKPVAANTDVPEVPEATDADTTKKP